MTEQKFQIHNIGNIFLAVVFLAYIPLGVVAVDADSAYGMGRRTGMIVGACTLAAIVAVIFSRIAYYVAGRSNKAATAGYMVGAGLIFLAHVGLVALNRAETGQIRGMERAAAKMDANNANMRRQVDEQGFVSDFSALSGTRQEIEKLAATSNKNDAMIYRAVADQLAMVEEAATERESATNAAVEAGMFDPAKFNSPADVEECGRAVQRARELAMKMHTIQKTMSADLEKRLGPIGASQSASAVLAKEFLRMSKDQTPLALATIETDLKLMDASLARLRILRDNWGAWEPDSDGGIIVGDGFGEQTLAEYNRLAKLETQLSAEQQQLNRKLVGLD